MKKKHEVKSEQIKNRILGFVVLLPFIYHVYRKILRLPIVHYNVIELLFSVFITFLLVYLLVSLYFKIVNGKFLNRLFTMIAFSLIILYSCFTYASYKELDINVLYKISEVFSDKNYENKIIIPANSNLTYTSTDVPSNIENIIIYNNDEISLDDSSISITICSDEKCSVVSSKNYSLDETNNKLTIKIDEDYGYSVNNVIVDSNIDENWIEKIEYNNQDVFVHMKNILTSKTLVLYSLLVAIVISFLYVMAIGIKKIVNSNNISKMIKKCKDSYNISRINFKIEDVFLLLGLTFGLIFCFIIPPYNVPDEGTHILWAYEAIGYEHIFVQINESYDCPTCKEVILGTEHGLNKEEFALNNKVKLTDNSFKTPELHLRILSYAPQIIGFLIGQFLDLPIYWILIFGEIFATIFYVILGYFILKILPFKKEIMFLILLLPMTIQQCCSLSYDCTLIMLSLLLFTLNMRLWYNEEDITIKKLLPLIAITCVIATIKLPYVFMLLSIFVIPLSKFKLKFGKYETNLYSILKKKFVLALLITFSIIVAVFIVPRIQIGRWIITCFLEPGQIFLIVKNTLIILMQAYMTSMVANFGWLNIPAAFYFVLLVISFTIFISFYKKNTAKEKTYPLYAKVIMPLIFIVIAALVAVAMIFSWTIPINVSRGLVSIEELRNALMKIDVIQGIQGRYFIPILPLILFIPNRCNIRIKDREYNILTILLYLISFAYSIYLLLFRFWM